MMIRGQILRPASIAEEVPDFNEVDDACPVCGGQGIALGTLGYLLYFRCRTCGNDFSVNSPDSYNADARDEY